MSKGILCDRCGNTYYATKLIKKENGKKYSRCVYCNYEQIRIFRNKPKKKPTTDN